MKRFLFAFLATIAIVLLPAPQISAQQTANATISNVTPGTLPQAEIERIIRAFTARETEFRKALNLYGFIRNVEIYSIGAGGQKTGAYIRNSQFAFGDDGTKFEKILKPAPMPTLQSFTFTTEDLEDLGGVQPFALETDKINQYNFTYAGTEKIDELDTYVFDVTPKAMSDPKQVKQLLKNKQRLFQGRIWVDKQDLQIVKTRGKGVPEDKNNKYPTFETYREQVDGKYWFPTYTYADDELVFGNGNVARLRMRVRYKDYTQARGRLILVEDDGDAPEDTPAPAKPNAPPAPPKP